MKIRASPTTTPAIPARVVIRGSALSSWEVPRRAPPARDDKSLVMTTAARPAAAALHRRRARLARQVQIEAAGNNAPDRLAGFWIGAQRLVFDALLHLKAARRLCRISGFVDVGGHGWY